MGQRLTINIIKNEIKDNQSVEKLLANAYFHWGGYTEDAKYYTNDVIYFLKDNKEEDFTDEVLYAVRALEETGAGFEKCKDIEYSEYDAIKKVYPNEEFTFFDSSENRTMGHISILEDAIWAVDEAEFTVTINLTTKTVNFGVCDKNKVDEFLKWYDDYTQDDIDNFKEYDYDAENLSFEDVSSFANALIDNNNIKLSKYPDYIFTSVEQ